MNEGVRERKRNISVIQRDLDKGGLRQDVVGVREKLSRLSN